MTTLQIAFVAFIVGTVCGITIAMLVRPYDFREPPNDTRHRDAR